MPKPPPPPVTGPAAGTAVLLCNLGTPDEPTPRAVRRYLAEFLADPRVVELPRLLWLPLLHGVILPLRAGKSAAKYRTIWTPDGSPLRFWTERQAKRLQGWLGEQGYRVRVAHAMRYGEPAIARQLDGLVEAGAGRILVLPAYPQHSGTTTASVVDAAQAWSARRRQPPALRFVTSYHDDRGYIQALARSIELHWRGNGLPDHLVMSFHGVPQRMVDRGDPYEKECRTTAGLLAQALQLGPERCSVAFQSRFGKAKWLEPATEPTLKSLARAGCKRVDVVCPGFAVDCLETLEEIAQEGRAAFLAAGGREFHYIPCLNDRTEWIHALGAIAVEHLGDWAPRVQPKAAGPAIY